MIPAAEREASLLASVLAEEPVVLVPATGVVVPGEVLGVVLVVLVVDEPPVVDPVVDPVVGVVGVVGLVEELLFLGGAEAVPVVTGEVAVPVPVPEVQVTPEGAFWTVNLSE